MWFKVSLATFSIFGVRHGVLAYWMRVSFTHIDALCNTMCARVVSKTPSEAHARVNKRLASQVRSCSKWRFGPNLDNMIGNLRTTNPPTNSTPTCGFKKCLWLRLQISRDGVDNTNKQQSLRHETCKAALHAPDAWTCKNKKLQKRNEVWEFNLCSNW